MIRLAVIGAGQWGPNLLRNFHNRERSEVAWVVDLDPVRLQQVRRRFPGVSVTSDLSVAMADARVDAIVVATPTSTHYPLTRVALEAGKHVFVEKPVATSSREALELVAIAERHRRVLMVGHVFLHNNGVARVKQHLDAGDLGRVYYVSMVRTNLGPVRADVNAAWDLAAHDISIVNHWLEAEPLSASAIGGAWIRPGIEDAVFATLRYPNQVLVNLHVSWLNPRKARDITVVGDRRMLTFDDMNLDEPVRIYDKRLEGSPEAPVFTDTFATFRSSIREGSIIIPRVPLGEPLRTECEHFIDCIEQGRQPVACGRTAARVVRALEAIAVSVRNHGREEPVSDGGYDGPD